MEAHEESEVAESLGRVLRVATGGQMQLMEMNQRRRQMSEAERQREDQQNARRDQVLAAALQQTVFTREYWRTAGSESIADNFTVLAQLRGQHPQAETAYAHMKNVLRTDFGINVEDANRDHPDAISKQHHELRDALDDHFAKKHLDAEADETLAAAIGRNEPEIVAEVGELREAADEAKESEEAHLEQAAEYEAEAGQDQEHASTEAAQLTPAGAYTRATAQALERVRETAGADAAASRETQSTNFPQNPEAQVRTGSTRRPARRAGLQSRQSRRKEAGRGR
ncbi:hypothetical protein [Neomicrococcus lactis]|uniref:Uncharacterized protein n=1 Tax=Neomicrococcus lactis TaxID=732241 RepID=A0A7W8YD33_9MICC|nr:hypothetical protein [Neomicrococcus lactis]MBB5599363.1 hypothetical protein [Neomicrococcus lactis]